MENNELDQIKGEYMTVVPSQLSFRPPTPSELKAAKSLSQHNQNGIIKMMAGVFVVDVVLTLLVKSFIVFAFLTAFVLLLAIPLSNTYKSSLNVTRGKVISKRIKQGDSSSYLVTVEINGTHIVCEDITCAYKHDYDILNIDSEVLIVNIGSSILAICPPDEDSDTPALDVNSQK